MTTDEPPVPGRPEEAEQLLYLMLGRAIAQCQVAEAMANSIHELLLGQPARERATLGSKAKAVEPELPSGLHSEFMELVEARNYLVHNLLFDHGGWTGVLGLDGPDLYGKLYASIREATQTIERVSNLLRRHLATTRPDALFLTIDEHGVHDLRDT
ncbi:hypothetical protein F8O01_06355 [Pseudoclavibacter chungangensis]|uniref:Uncharacterized protein n=1 Tax=Pseudoclavibacter chungangensis TaxID=587635 RepID=A0A7J5BWN4_9MICO|nr:hypothetical protein [Pseudoclavibacter chungangensis]KAB1657900.1 hypothetical protein F8O01_06355 [Pseudoclavibacter chungangensis]NYJ65957.1 hypothetical protein [Pseudoclavibacter chungangensis]